MVLLTRLNGQEVVVNAQLIETVEATPDTVVTLTTHRKIVVREPPEEIVRQVQAYWRGTYGRSPRQVEAEEACAAVGPGEGLEGGSLEPVGDATDLK